MKRFYAFVICLLTFLYAHKTFAQRGVPAAYVGDYNRMMSQNFANMNMQRMMNMNLYKGYGYMVNQKYKFKVVMKDSTVKMVKSKINMDTALHKSYLTYDDKTIKDKKLREQRIYSNQTISISRTDYNNNITGMANDSCWFFKVLEGKINAFSPLSETEDIDSFYLRAYQLGNGPVQKLDSASLAPIIAKSPKALKAFKKKDYYKAIDKYNSDKSVAN
ncbi:MAG: hypothetical protein WC615_19320 [Mucilaginibacter sp.]|jgi:hypothetical protein|uniref:hypothetical protein n=1 Tax=Mucilaginibacter sp. TaxID=1882438 RepID=UPI00356A3D1A